MAYDSRSRTIAIDQTVSVPDVQQALGTNCNNLATLCALSNINKWSRFKPIRDPRPTIQLTEKASNTSPFYNYQLSQMYMNFGVEGNVPSLQGSCGLNIRAHQASKLIDDTATAMDWEYLPPSGQLTLDGVRRPSTQSQYWTAQRIGDFRGYKHNASCPFHDLLLGNVLPYGGEIPLRHVLGLTQATGSIEHAVGLPGSGVSLNPGSLTLSELMFPGTTKSFVESKLALILFRKTDANGTVDPYTFRAATVGRTNGLYSYFTFPTGAFVSGWQYGAVAIPCYALNTIDASAAWKDDTRLVIHPNRLRFDVTFGSTTGSQIINVQVTIARREQFGSMSADGSISSVHPISWTLKITVEDNGGGGNYHEFNERTMSGENAHVIELLDSNGNILWQSNSIINNPLGVTGSFTQSGQISRFTTGVTSDSQLENATRVRVRLGVNYSGERYIMNYSSSGQLSAILP